MLALMAATVTDVYCQRHFPVDAPLPGAADLDPVPYVVTGDKALTLQMHLVRPFPGRGCPQDQQMYNYIL